VLHLTPIVLELRNGEAIPSGFRAFGPALQAFGPGFLALAPGLVAAFELQDSLDFTPIGVASVD
jgi:hypothetical protein